MMRVQGPCVARRPGNHLGGAVDLGDVRQQGERGELGPAPISAGHHQIVVAVVAVMILVVVDSSRVLGPGLDLVELEVGGPAESLGCVDEVGVKRQTIQIEGLEWPVP